MLQLELLSLIALPFGNFVIFLANKKKQKLTIKMFHIQITAVDVRYV